MKLNSAHDKEEDTHVPRVTVPVRLTRDGVGVGDSGGLGWQAALVGMAYISPFVLRSNERTNDDWLILNGWWWWIVLCRCTCLIMNVCWIIDILLEIYFPFSLSRGVLFLETLELAIKKNLDRLLLEPFEILKWFLELLWIMIFLYILHLPTRCNFIHVLFLAGLFNVRHEFQFFIFQRAQGTGRESSCLGKLCNEDIYYGIHPKPRILLCRVQRIRPASPNIHYGHASRGAEY